jgi:hypothetical protein
MKICASCGREMTWRKRWASTWETVRYCSRACARRGVNRIDRALEDAILELLEHRPAGHSICPSEAARAVNRDRWRRLMEPARRAARRLVAEGRLEMTQRGRVTDPSIARGPVRLRLSNLGKEA